VKRLCCVFILFVITVGLSLDRHTFTYEAISNNYFHVVSLPEERNAARWFQDYYFESQMRSKPMSRMAMLPNDRTLFSGDLLLSNGVEKYIMDIYSSHDEPNRIFKSRLFKAQTESEVTFGIYKNETRIKHIITLPNEVIEINHVDQNSTKREDLIKKYVIDKLTTHQMKKLQELGINLLDHSHPKQGVPIYALYPISTKKTVGINYDKARDLDELKSKRKGFNEDATMVSGLFQKNAPHIFKKVVPHSLVLNSPNGLAGLVLELGLEGRRFTTLEKYTFPNIETPSYITRVYDIDVDNITKSRKGYRREILRAIRRLKASSPLGQDGFTLFCRKEGCPTAEMFLGGISKEIKMIEYKQACSNVDLDESQGCISREELGKLKENILTVKENRNAWSRKDEEKILLYSKLFKIRDEVVELTKKHKDSIILSQRTDALKEIKGLQNFYEEERKNLFKLGDKTFLDFNEEHKQILKGLDVDQTLRDEQALLLEGIKYKNGLRNSFARKFFNIRPINRKPTSGSY
jgi:hypothetical protein